MLGRGFVILALLSAAPSCSSSSDDSPVFTGGEPSSAGSTDDGGPATTTAGPGSTGGGGETSDTGATAADGAIFDVGAAPDLELESGCQKVDILFVIDATGSMAVHQQALVDSYQGFVDGIASHFGNDHDFHIGVITADNYDYNPPVCQELGALVTQVASPDYQSTIDCTPYAEGNRFMTEADNLSVKFPCTASVQMPDFFEKPVTGAIAAVQPAINGPGGCNDGFLRDDALLVLVLITNSMTGDDPQSDANPQNDPTPWHPAIVAAKGGHPENAVAIGFLAAGDTWCIPNGWDGYQAPNLIDFVQDFGPNGVVANVCLPDYGPVFQDSIDVVLDACDDFVPPG